MIEDKNKKYGVEAAFGVTNTVSKINGLKNSIQADSINVFLQTDDNKQIKLADAVTVVANLLHEGLKIGASNTPRRVLREYIKAMQYWSEKNNISNYELAEIIERYEFAEYNCNTQHIKEFNEQLKKGEF